MGAFHRGLEKEGWKRVFENADREVAASYIRHRLSDWKLWPDILSAYLTVRFAAETDLPGELRGELEGLFRALAHQFPRRANVDFNWNNYVQRTFFYLLAKAAAERSDSHQAWRSWLARFFRKRWGNLKEQPRALGILATVVFSADEYREMLSLASADDLVDVFEWASELFQHLAEFAPDGVAEVLGRWWAQRSFEDTEWTWSKKNEWERGHRLKQLLPLLDSRALECLALQLGLTIGLILAKLSFFLAKQGLAASDDRPEVARELEKFGLPRLSELPEEVRFQSCLWRDLQILAKYKKESYRRGTELLGLRSSLMEAAATHPTEWAHALPWVLECSQHLDGLAEAVTVTLMGEAKEVAAAVDALASGDLPREVRDRARGLQALSHGLLDPSDRLRQDLLSFAARQLDGEAFTAQALAAPSSTWLSSQDLEAFLRSGAGDAESRFREYFLTQGGIEEEAVTGRLLSELERAFDTVRARASRASGSRSRLPTVKLVHRQVPKKEEKQYGCDVAFLVSVVGRRIQGAEAAEFVQVKKPVRERSGTSFVDRWRVATRQLEDLLHTSPTSVYWLLGAQGEVLVVPAKTLSALAPQRGWGGRGKPAGSFNLSYFKLRSAAVPLSQFLIDLLVGLWLGTIHPQALDFAKGNARATVPRFIVEVTVDHTGEAQG